MTDRSVVVRLIADTSSYDTRMRGAARSTRSVGDAGRYTSDRLSDVKKVVAGFAIGTIIKAGVEFDALKQRSQAAFTTITGSSTAARRELDLLYGQFKNNPFGYPQILKSSQQLLAMGTQTKDLVRTVRDLSDATAAVGGNADLMDRVALAIGQMKAKGTIQAEEMRQLAENGIPAWQLLAHEIGVSVPEAMKMVEKRQVDSQRGVDALLAGIEQRFGGATANLRNTWTGTLTAFKTEAIQAGGEIVKPLMRIGTDGMHALEPLLKGAATVGNAFSGLPSPMQNTALALGAVMLLSNRLNGAWSSMSAGVGSFRNQMRMLQSVATLQGRGLSNLGAAAQAAGQRVQTLGASMLSAFGGPLGLAITGATLGLSLYQNAEQDAAAAAREHRAEVDALSSALDKNTLRLTENGRAEQVNAFLAQSGTVPGTSGSLSDTLTGRGINPELARRAILGDAAAMAQLTRAVNANKGAFFQNNAILTVVRNKAGELREAIKQTADTMRLAIPDAAHQTGVAATTVYQVFDRWRAKGGNLQAMLRAAGLTASDASQIFNILAGNAANATSAFGGLSSAADQLHKDLAGAVGQFASVGGAWDAAVSAAQAATGGSGRTPSASDDPRYRRAKKAYEDAQRALRHLRQADKDRIQPLKDEARAESEAAAAAAKRATALQKVATAAKKAADEAEAARKKAQDQKDLADRNAHDAAALAAAIKTQAGHAGTADQGAYGSALGKAQLAVTATAAAQVAATATLSARTADAAAKKAASDSATAAAKKAKADAAAARQRADAAKKAAHDLATALEHIERAHERTIEKLLDARNRAERIAQRKSEKASSGVSGAYGSVAKDAKISLDDYLDTLDKQVAAQRKWKENLITLAAKVPPGVALGLAKLGPQAAPLVQQLVDGSDQQLKRFVRLFRQSGTGATSAISTELQNGIPLISAVAKSIGDKAAAKLAAALADGTTSVDQAMHALGATVGKNPLDITLGIKNRKKIAEILDGLTHPKDPYKIPVWLNAKGLLVHGQPAKKSGISIGGLWDGGWVSGGVRGKDSVPKMLAPDEFVVRQKYARRYGPLLEAMNSGRFSMSASAKYSGVPSAAPAPASRTVYVGGDNRPAYGKHVVNQFAPGAIVQQPGQSSRDLLREVDRLADLGMGGS